MRTKKWLAGIVSVLLVLLVFIVPMVALAYAYAGTATVAVTESAGTDYSMLPVTFTAGNSSMATYGFMSATGLDAQVQSTSGTALPTMIADTQTLFAAPITKSTSNGFNFTTGNTPLTSMPIIVGNGGYITTADNAALEPGTAFSITTNGYVDTSIPVTAGNTLTNGGGVATGSPVTLVNGINTITVSTLGTFTILLQNGISAKVESVGTCIVTGSPVQLSTGSNTITTIGATGTITVTVNMTKNIISKTGALSVYVDPIVSGTINASIPVYSALVTTGTSASGYGFALGKYGQTFTTTSVRPITQIELEEATTVFTDVQVGIYATSGGNPVGTPLAISQTGSGTGWVSLPLPTPFVPTNSTMYAVLAIAGTGGWEYGAYTSGGFGYATLGSGNVISTWSGSSTSYSLMMRIDTCPYVTVAGVSSGVHTITISETAVAGGTLSLQVDAGVASTVTSAGSVPNTANDWILNQNDVMPYINYYKETVGVTEVIKYQPATIIAGTALPNLDSAGSYPGVITFGTNPAGIAVTLGPLTATSSGTSSVGGGASGVVGYVPASSSSLINAETPPSLAAITFPLEPVVHAIATMWTASSPMSTPATELVLIRSFAGLTIVGGAIASLLLIHGHLFIAGIAGMALMGLWCAWHVYPLAAISIAVIFLIGTILADRGGSD